MGQIIRLLRVGHRIEIFEEDAPDTYRDLSKGELRKAISGCLEVRRQIGILLELAVQAERIIDDVSDKTLQKQLREKKVLSHAKLTTALTRTSTAIAALATVLKKYHLHGRVDSTDTETVDVAERISS